MAFKSDSISELFNLFSLIVKEESYLEDQKSLLAENALFYPETAFEYLKNFKIFMKRSVKQLQEDPESVNIFDPGFINKEAILVTEKKGISAENFEEFLKFNDCQEDSLFDISNFLGYYFPSNSQEIDYSNFLDLFLPHSNKEKRRACLKRKILYQYKTLESITIDLRVQSLLSSILDDEIQLFKRLEELKLKLLNEFRWDPVEAFNSLDEKEESFLTVDSLSRFFENFGAKFSSRDFSFLLKRIRKDNEAECLYFEDFKRIVLPFKPYATPGEKTQVSRNETFTKSQVLMERIDQARNDDKYLILKSTMRPENPNLSQVTSPAKIRQAVFDETGAFENNAQVVLSLNSSKVMLKSSNNRSNLVVSGLLGSSQKPAPANLNQTSHYASKNEGMAGKSLVYSRFPQSKVIQDLYGEHKFTNLSLNAQTSVRDFPQFPQSGNLNRSNEAHIIESVVSPKTNFDNDRLLGSKSHERKIYTPIRENPKLALSLSNDPAIRGKVPMFSSPTLTSKPRKPLFYSNTKELTQAQSLLLQSNYPINNMNLAPNPQKSLLSQGPPQNLNSSQMMLNFSASPKKRIFDSGQKAQNINQSKNLAPSMLLNSGIKGQTPNRNHEPEMAKKFVGEKDSKGNICKPTPHILI